MTESADEDEGKVIEGSEHKNGLYCFLDSSRECGADCMAYTQGASESKALGQQQQNCLLIVATERLGRYVGNIASDVHKMQDRSAKEAADRLRFNVSSPPDPRGGKS